MEEKLRRAGLTSKHRHGWIIFALVAFIVLIIGACGYKIYVSSPYARFVWLVLASVAGIVGVALTGRRLGPTSRGRRLLEEARDRSANVPTLNVAEGVRPDRTPEQADRMLWGMAIMGVAAMAGTEYAYYSDVFKADRSDFGSGCSGCGGCSSCSSCGGCGG